MIGLMFRGGRMRGWSWKLLFLGGGAVLELEG
jgi:hypothetical protein